LDIKNLDLSPQATVLGLFDAAVELSRILTNRSPRLAGLRETLKEFIVNNVIAGLKARVQAIEDELTRRERQIRRSRLKIIEGGRR
jgi:hypothetical protein